MAQIDDMRAAVQAAMNHLDGIAAAKEESNATSAALTAEKAAHAATQAQLDDLNVQVAQLAATLAAAAVKA